MKKPSATLKLSSPLIAILTTAFLLSCSGSSTNFEGLRRDMIESQIKARGLNNDDILQAMSSVPREIFVMEKFKAHAYDDNEVPISNHDSLNRPFEDAAMLDALDLKSSDRVMEVGTGTGYFASLLSKLAGEVFTIEIEPPLAERARKILPKLGIRNVKVVTGDGFLGLPEHAPYDAIVMQCSPPQVPEPLVEQLKEGGRLLAPIGGGEKFQELTLFVKKDGKLSTEKRLSPANFTPMRGIILEK
ncbi:MAG TPA: protein-L-isoaspartate(D-aspartate) O-methyltransferase [bacterium]|nr:protein-L-isoaspartate(D-aspartate) O-methyltransferase [Myxococcales bacterium]OQA58973.1 MAG: Protein-L-isoaspartate O-methyltransferase [bacterium ADurb.Bin270]HPW45239.1 protein-L-isoaspartate(D-aspartate) O-methyltransferase [bacterium]HQC50295.1 protein-L-isoaspartate(D-aspartate) O-methyltransferase [bacterium]HQG13245.1 protein-L-isoaspartate(D-aspartate) O-methyltransferase [bacterium]